MLCAYLLVALLLGLGANAFLGWWWADPLTALVFVAVAFKEGWETWHGDPCCDVKDCCPPRRPHAVMMTGVTTPAVARGLLT
jgi:hypothetical protein